MNIKNIETFNKRKGRLIVINGIKWKWRVGNCLVIAYSENGEKLCGDAWNIKGITPDDFERGQRKKTNSGSVFPSEVAKWLGNISHEN